MKTDEPPDFDSVADAPVKRAFLGRGPEFVEWLPPGTKLYKWTKSILNPRGVSPWWFFLESRALPNGKAAGQLEDQAVPNVFLIAGDYQVWIPGIPFAEVSQISVVPYMLPNP